MPHWHPEQLDLLARWKKPRIVFVQSMGDLYGAGVPGQRIHEVWNATQGAKQHTYLVVTKSPARLRAWTEEAALARGWPVEDIWPENFWLATSITIAPDALARLPHLVAMPTLANRAILVEPLLGPVDLRWHLHWPWCRRHPSYADASSLPACTCREGRGPIDWVILGAQTGPGAVVPRAVWIEAVVNHCRHAGVPLFMKGNLAKHWRGELIQEFPPGLPGVRLRQPPALRRRVEVFNFDFATSDGR